MHVHDIHASILWMLGLDHMQTTYLHNGRAERPTVLAGNVIKEIWNLKTIASRVRARD